MTDPEKALEDITDAMELYPQPLQELISGGMPYDGYLVGLVSGEILNCNGGSQEGAWIKLTDIKSYRPSGGVQGTDGMNSYGGLADKIASFGVGKDMYVRLSAIAWIRAG